MFARVLLLLLAGLSTAQAHTITITLEDVDSALTQAASEGDVVEQLLLDKIDEELQHLELSWQDGQLVYPLDIPDQELDGGCGYSADLRRFEGELRADRSSAFGLTFTSLKAPLSLDTGLLISLDANARIDQTYGVKVFGDCRHYATDDVRLSITGQLEAAIGITVNPQLSLNNGMLQLAPIISANATLNSFTYTLDVRGSPLDGQLEDRLRDAIDDAFNDSRVTQLGEALAANLQRQLAEALGGDSIILALPALDATRQQQLLSLLDIPLFSELGEVLVRNHLPELFYIILSGDSAIATSFLSDVAVCELLASQLQALPRHPLYTRDDQSCIVAEIPSPAATLYTDKQCADPVNVREPSVADFCEEILDTERLGHPTLPVHTTNTWEPARGATLDIGILALKGPKQPFMQRTAYRQIDTANGTCTLEMRVFKADIAARNLKPLLWLHGGSWTYRRDGMLGLEAQVSHYTDRGFVVFEPVYRLTGQHEGTAACQQATGADIISDAEAALDWVIDNAPRYGADSLPAVAGQSADAHLAGWLGVHRAADVAKALLFYPPTDFAHFIGRYQRGRIDVRSQGLRALSRFVGQPLEDLQTDDPFVVQNSFPSLIAQNPGTYPPFFIVHGSGDSIVPVDQSTRLCASFSGNPDNATQEPTFTDAHYVESCGTNGELHLIDDAEHALDICLFDVWCAAGDDQAQQAAQRAVDWVSR